MAPIYKGTYVVHLFAEDQRGGSILPFGFVALT